MGGIESDLLAIIVSAPGQNSLASILASGENPTVYSSSSVADDINIGNGVPSGRFFNWNTLLTADTSSAMLVIPYTVSVGMQTTPPSNKMLAAKIKDSSLTESI